MDPPLQAVALDDSTLVIRQGKHVHVEAPFLYLLVGTEAALLHDTGGPAEAERSPIRRTVEELLEGRQLRILVTHSQVVPHQIPAHAHGAGRRSGGVVGSGWW